MTEAIDERRLKHALLVTWMALNPNRPPAEFDEAEAQELKERLFRPNRILQELVFMRADSSPETGA